MLNIILWPDHIQWQLPTDQTLYRTRPFTEFWEISIEHLWWGVACRQVTLSPPDTWSRLLGTYIWCGMPTEHAYSSGHLVLSHFGTCMCSNVETNLSWTCLVSELLNFEHPSVLLFCFYLLRPILFPNLSLFFRTFLFEYSSLISRFPSILISSSFSECHSGIRLQHHGIVWRVLYRWHASGIWRGCHAGWFLHRR